VADSISKLNALENGYKTTLLAMKGLDIKVLAGFSLYPVKVKAFI